MGWYVEEYGLAQVSMNLEDFRVTAPHEAFLACVEEAAALGVAVCGSELVGLIPLEAVLLAAEHFIRAEESVSPGRGTEGSPCRRETGPFLGAAIRPVQTGHRVHACRQTSSPLASKTVRDFVRALGARTPTPGGGSASALVAAMGAALGTMVGLLTYGKRRFEDKDALMRALIPPLHRAMEALIPIIDEDSRAFDAYTSALGLPKDTEAERAYRLAAMQSGLREAVLVPLSAMRQVDGCWDALEGLATHGNFASRSDLEVGARALEMGSWGCGRNVAINLEAIDDEAFRLAIVSEADGLGRRAIEKRERVLEVLAKRALTADSTKPVP